jgi:hypothetical protein
VRAVAGADEGGEGTEDGQELTCAGKFDCSRLESREQSCIQLIKKLLVSG